ncbi:MAG: glycoside hydrolase family 130 protein [Negativicutes bacterium]|nr:glycoside hydrolase family 130 protein [Negativicutes bacterium]
MGGTRQTLSSAACIVRQAKNPILSADRAPYECSLLFNAGVIKYQGKYIMVFRNDYGATEQEFASGQKTVFQSKLGIATSDNGVDFTIENRVLWQLGGEDQEILRVYDPRLTVVDGRVYMCFAMDTRHGIRGGIATTDDFYRFDILHLTVPDNRNMVLFPEKIGGRYFRLERPFPVYGRGGRDRFDIWASASPDMRYWGDSELVLAVEDVPFADDKIGPAAPPVKTAKGWLTTFHAVDRDDTGRGKNGWEPKWTKRYTAGIMLLDLENPARVIGMSKQPLIAPEASCETSGGFRNDVIFPGGMILEPDGEVKIYYGAADTVECLATAPVDDLLALCSQPR